MRQSQAGGLEAALRGLVVMGQASMTYLRSDFSMPYSASVTKTGEQAGEQKKN